jgi:hypothetical protein
MSLNLTAAWLAASRSAALLAFSGAVTTSSTFLAGAGGAAADGFPVPGGGRVAGLAVYDGSTTYDTDATVELAPGDRVCLYATWTGSDFSVSVVVNGVISAVTVDNVPGNCTLLASLPLLLKEV